MKEKEEKVTLTLEEYEQLKKDAEAKKTVSISAEEYKQLKAGIQQTPQNSCGIGLSDNDVKRISGMKPLSSEKEYADFMFKASGHMLGKVIALALKVFIIGIIIFIVIGNIGKIFLKN